MTCPHCSTPMLCPKCTRSAQIKQGLANGRKGGRPMKHGFAPVLIARINALRDKGMSYAEIARALGVPKSTCHRMVRDAS